MPAAKRTADSPAGAAEKKARTDGLQLFVDGLGAGEISLEVPEDCKTAAQLHQAVAAAASLDTGAFDLLHADGTEVQDDGVTGLEAGARLKAKPGPALVLVQLVERIKDAAKKNGTDITLQDGASDEDIRGLKSTVGKRRVPACVEYLLRRWNGIQFGVKGFSEAGISSVEDILEIYEYSDYMKTKFDSVSCLPWKSIDCEFAFLVLELRGDMPILWMIDAECQSSSCYGPLDGVLQQMLAFLEGTTDSKELKQVRRKGSSFDRAFMGDEDEDES